MTKLLEEPVVTMQPGPGGMQESCTRHPSFAQIGASRVSGHTQLYDSDFHHNAYMTISIRRSELHRHLNNDWHYGREELIEVALSEAQWATFVSAPNVGSGVPCTLQHINREQIPQLPPPPTRTKQFAAELREDMAEAAEALAKALEAVDSVGLSKAKAETIREGIIAAQRKLTFTVPFVVSQFDEHMEGTVEKAKAEVHGYMTGAVMRHGLEALGGHLPLQIEGHGTSATDPANEPETGKPMENQP